MANSLRLFSAKTDTMNPIRLIIFDFDGTLGDTRQTIVRTFQATMEALGMEVADEAACAATIGLPLKEGFLQIFPHISEAQATACVQTYKEIFEKNRRIFVPVLFPHVKETLAWLHAQGIQMTIASSRSSRSLHELVEELDIKPYISYILGADNVSKAKPDPAPVLQTLQALNMEANQTLVIGDMPVDIAMGKRAGTRAFGVSYGNATAEELQEAGADCIMGDLAELRQRMADV